MSIHSLSLEGKVAIVTGGGTGIGRSIAQHFAEAGADVVVASRRLPVLEKVAEEVKAFGRRSLAIQTDIVKKADVDNLVKRTMDEFGNIDILVNSAGIAEFRPLLDYSEQEWDRMVNINLKGCYLCSRAVAKGMVEKKKGNIINIASTDAFFFDANNTPYSASKAGVVMLTRGMAKELGSCNIRINAIAPGWVRTAIAEELLLGDPVATREAEAAVPMGRLAEPEDVAHAALFLSSDLSSYITGTTLVVDGGVIA